MKITHVKVLRQTTDGNREDYVTLEEFVGLLDLMTVSGVDADGQTTLRKRIVVRGKDD